MDFGETTVAPWEDESDTPSLIPRNARIASSLQLVYWARGRKYLSNAQNFSKRGLFLSTSGAPPVRGAIVRIEFPIEGSEETVAVRFNAEVRWHSVDRPQDGDPKMGIRHENWFSGDRPNRTHIVDFGSLWLMAHGGA